MKVIQEIIEREGGLERLTTQDGFYIRLERSGYMPLVIEHIGTGPRGLPLISVAHYYMQNGDAMRDPEITFEIVKDPVTIQQLRRGEWRFLPVSYRQDGAGIYQDLAWKNDAGVIFHRPQEVRGVLSFVSFWNKNIRAQGFLDCPNVVKIPA